MSYVQLIRFLLPLMVTVLIQEFSGQVLNGGMARMPRATETLAGFGLAWGLVTFLSGTLTQARQLGLVLVEHIQAYQKVSWFVVAAGLLLAGLLACLAFTPLGTWVIEDLHGVERPLGAVVRRAFFWLIPFPVFKGMTRFYTGMLIRIRRTDVVSYATVTGIGVSILAVFALLPAGFVQAQPIRLPILAIYASALTEFGIIQWGCRRYVRLSPRGSEPDLTLAYVVRFFWPLVLIMATQAGTRPLINLFVSRGPDGTEALAVLTVVYALGHVPYGWLNEVRNLPTAFQREKDSLAPIRRFILGCGLVSFGTMIVLFWTPAKEYILEILIGIGPELAVHCGVPLLIFSFFPFVVILRGYYHGIGLLEHRTRAMAPSAPSRLGAVLTTLTVLSGSDLHGATRAVAALLSGHTVEALVVWWGVKRGGSQKGLTTNRGRSF